MSSKKDGTEMNSTVLVQFELGNYTLTTIAPTAAAGIRAIRKEAAKSPNHGHMEYLKDEGNFTVTELTVGKVEWR